MPDSEDFEKIKHLHARAGFGLSAKYYKDATKFNLKKQVALLFENATNVLPLNLPEINPFDRSSYKILSPEDKKNYDKKDRDDIRHLNLIWLHQMSLESQQLREKMTLFWHGHFACTSNRASFVQQQNNTLRNLALGKFGDLLRAVSKDPAMLEFLNNRQNKKAHPNENFAREVMELFSLGIGNYTEQDIKEAARAFTGWEFNDKGEFHFNARQHDEGSKTIFKKEGTFTGDDVIDLLLEKKETAFHIVRKIYKFFVNDIPDEKHVTRLATGFYASQYDILLLMKTIFTADWFYSPENRACKIKSPVELLVGMARQLDIKALNQESFFKVQKLLGQVLFYPPNVAGWPGGKTWIDSSTLMIRLNLAGTVLHAATLEVKEKQELGADLMMTSSNENQAKKQEQALRTEINWKALQDQFPPQNNIRDLVLACSNFFLVKQVPETTIKTLIEAVNPLDPDTLKKVTGLVMSLPEYQTC
jgi:uncharacterized protein (DUF1800 family)